MMMKIRKVRDLTLVSLGNGQELVIACDSCGGIGLKPGDTLQVAPAVTGKFTARVVILEVMCTGAKVICLTNAVCNEMEPTGRELLTGVNEELKAAGIDSIALTGSTEENFPTVSTAVGITAIGIVDHTTIRVNTCKKDAWVIAVGMPKVGQEVLTGELPGYGLIRELLECPGVYEIVPVGSKGILYEARELARNNQLSLTLNQKINVDIAKSAGPCTTMLVAAGEDALEKLNGLSQAEVIGRLI